MSLNKNVIIITLLEGKSKLLSDTKLVDFIFIEDKNLEKHMSVICLFLLQND